MDKNKMSKKSEKIPFRTFSTRSQARHKELFAGMTNPWRGVSNLGNAAGLTFGKGGVGVKAKITF